MLQTFIMEASLASKTKNGRGGARPRSGPKPKPAREHRRNRMMLNFTDAEYRSLKDAAGGESLSDFARSIVLRHLARRRK